MEINNLIMADSGLQELKGSINGHIWVLMYISVIIWNNYQWISSYLYNEKTQTFWINDLAHFKSNYQKKKIFKLLVVNEIHILERKRKKSFLSRYQLRYAQFFLFWEVQE